VGNEGTHICLSHQPWDPPLGRPHRLMSRFAARRSVFFVEPPAGGKPRARLAARATADGVTVLTPHLPGPGGVDVEQKLIEGFVDRNGLDRYALWYDTPLAVSFTHRLAPSAVVYDRTSPPTGAATDDLQVADSALLLLADVVIVSSGDAPPMPPRGRVITLPAALEQADSAPEAWDAFFATLDDALAAITTEPAAPPAPTRRTQPQA
jgi:hypothetical protein